MEEQNKKENKEKEKETEPKEEKDIPKGYYLAEVPTGYGIVMMNGNEKVSVEKLIVKMANAVKEAGLFKD